MLKKRTTCTCGYNADKQDFFDFVAVALTLIIAYLSLFF